MKKTGITAILFAFFSTCMAQHTDSLELAGSAIIGRQVEHLEELAEAGLDLSELSADMEDLLENPLNINSAQRSDLKKLVFLNDMQIRNLLDYRNKYGEFVSIYELKHIDGLGINTLRKIMPFVVAEAVTEHGKTMNDLLNGKNEVLFRFQRKLKESAGYRKVSDSLLAESPGSYYLGDPSRLYLRYRYRVPKKLSLGILVEKDPGEQLFTKAYGPDLLSFHAAYEGNGIIRQLIAGDFHARFGQGLVFWSGLSFSGGSDPTSIKRYAPGISPNTSANENTFLRGAGLEIGWKRIRLTTLFSIKKVDANLKHPEDESPVYASSLQTSGYHRTVNEIDDRNAIRSMKAAVHLDYRREWFRAGVTSCYSSYDIELRKEPIPAYLFSYRGKENLCGGIDFDLVFRRTNLFGEFGLSRNGGVAIFVGLTHMTENGSIFAVSFREYGKAYQNDMAQAAGNRDHNANERGLRLMMELPLYQHFSLQASCDHFAYPWLTYGSINARRGQDYRIRIIYAGGLKEEYAIRYRFRNITNNIDPASSWFDILSDEQKHEVQASARMLLSASFSCKLLAAYVMMKNQLQGSEGQGSLALFDLYYQPPGKMLKLSMRYALFHTADYQSRIYAYEHDVLYASSMPAYYGKGFRVYLLAKYSPFRWLDAWFRFSLTTYTDRNSISSGPDEIKGNKLPEVKFQLRFKL